MNGFSLGFEGGGVKVPGTVQDANNFDPFGQRPVENEVVVHRKRSPKTPRNFCQHPFEAMSDGYSRFLPFDTVERIANANSSALREEICLVKKVTRGLGDLMPG